jgi:predicted Holliday junction resolvase-like endonuclease
MPLAILTFLRGLKLSHYAMIALALACVLLKLSLTIEQRHSAKLETQLVKANAELQRISTKRDEQKAVTRDTIEQAETVTREADKVAERIEAAPLPGSCKTPAIILESNDL